MSASKQNAAMVLVSGMALFSFLVFMTAIKGDNTLRIILASLGFLGFAGLLAALLVAKSKGLKA